MSLQLKNCEVCCIELVTGITREEIYEILREILNEMKIRFTQIESRFNTELGIIVVKHHEKSRLNLKLYKIEFPDEKILEKFREKLMSKRAGG